MTHDVTQDAGRELDALVAEKVMGWTVNRTGDRHWHTVGETGRERSIQIGSDCCAGQYYDNRAFCPSTDIRAAWEVVEKLALRPPLEALSCVIGTNAMSGGFQNGCKFYPAWQGAGHSIFDAEPHDGWDAVAATIPLAICLAAVRALGALHTSNTEQP